MCQVWIRLDVKVLRWSVGVSSSFQKNDGGSTTKKDLIRLESNSKRRGVFWGFMHVFPGFLTTSFKCLFGISRMFGAMNWPQMLFHVFSTHQILENLPQYRVLNILKKVGRKTGVWFSLGGDDFQVPVLSGNASSSRLFGLREMRPRISCSAFVRLICS